MANPATVPLGDAIETYNGDFETFKLILSGNLSLLERPHKVCCMRLFRNSQ
jgi:hypothetical protein